MIYDFVFRIAQRDISTANYKAITLEAVWSNHEYFLEIPVYIIFEFVIKVTVVPSVVTHCLIALGL